SKIPPGSLMLEITESTLIKDMFSAMNILKKLKGQNVRLVLDDFGTGYSSLNYLHTFPFDTLKIDRSFVDGMTFEEDKAKIVKAMLSLANDLGMDVVAEGVETEEQALTLKALKCRWLQGFYFGKPATPEEIEKRLDHRAF